MDEIWDMTFDQISAFEKAVYKREERKFRSDVASTLYGAQYNAEEVIDKIIMKE